MSTHIQPHEAPCKPWGFRTLAVHAGQSPDTSTGAIAPPIVATSAFAYDDFEAGERRFNGEAPGYVYSRFANPTVAAFERKMAALEGGETAVGFASGMAAISASLLGLLKAGDVVACVGTLYGGTDGVMRSLLPRLGVTVRHFRTVDALRAGLDAGTRIVYVETPSNPTLEVMDLAQVAQIARQAGAISIADNTFSTPYLTRPLALGMDVVVHSATKFISGHGDATGGVAVGRAELLGPIRAAGMGQLGGCLSPHEAVMLLRGLKTLPLRVEAACTNAEALARWLQAQPAVARVYYPGLATHPGHGVAAQQMRRFGAILSLDLRGGRAAARQFLDGLRIVTQAVSVGDVDSLACHPASTTHHSVPEPVRLDNGVSDALVRMSVGVEDGDDLLADVAQALARV